MAIDDRVRQKYLKSLSKDFTSQYFVATSDAIPKIMDIISNNEYGIRLSRDEDASIEIAFPALLMWYTIPMRNLFNEKDANSMAEDIIKNVTKVTKLDLVTFETNFKELIRFFNEYFGDLENHRAADWLIYCLTENKEASFDEKFMPLRLQIEEILLKSYPFDWTKAVK